MSVEALAIFLPEIQHSTLAHFFCSHIVHFVFNTGVNLVKKMPLLLTCLINHSLKTRVTTVYYLHLKPQYVNVKQNEQLTQCRVKKCQLL